MLLVSALMLLQFAKHEVFLADEYVIGEIEFQSGSLGSNTFVFDPSEDMGWLRLVGSLKL